MSFPWQAERTIEPELAFELIKIQFPFLKPLQLTLLGVGWDNSAFLLDKKYVFRSDSVWFGMISVPKKFALALQFSQLGVSFRIRWLLNTLFREQFEHFQAIVR